MIWPPSSADLNPIITCEPFLDRSFTVREDNMDGRLMQVIEKMGGCSGHWIFIGISEMFICILSHVLVILTLTDENGWKGRICLPNNCVCSVFQGHVTHIIQCLFDTDALDMHAAVMLLEQISGTLNQHSKALRTEETFDFKSPFRTWNWTQTVCGCVEQTEQWLTLEPDWSCLHVRGLKSSMDLSCWVSFMNEWERHSSWKDMPLWDYCR